jgi:poly(3-hydroxybutyrate) depolymerase
MRWLKVVAASLAGLTIGLGILIGLAYHQGSPSAFLERKGRIVEATLAPAGEDSTSVFQELTLRSSTGLEVRALLRLPRASRPPYSAAVIVGGIKRGRKVVTAAGLEAIARQAIVVSPDYPIHPRRWSVLHLRPAAFDTVAEVLLLLDYLESRPDVERHRMFLIGGSMGAVFATVAGGVDPRPAAVIALYGGARLGPLVAHTLEHPAQESPYPHWQAVLAGHALAWLLTPLDPARYAARISPRPFLMLNGSEDSLVPRSSVLALYGAAREPKELIWVKSEHVQPSEAQLLRELSGIVASWLVQRGLLPTPS